MRLPIEGLTDSPGFKSLGVALTAMAPSGSFPPYIDGVLFMLEGFSPGGVEEHPGGCIYSSSYLLGKKIAGTVCPVLNL